MFGLSSLSAGKEKTMNAWSEYLRTQAVLADRISRTMTTAATVKEFADYAEGFRQGRGRRRQNADASQGGSQDFVARPAWAPRNDKVCVARGAAGTPPSIRVHSARRGGLRYRARIRAPDS